MDAERKTGGMARKPVGYDTDTKRQIRNQASVNSQEEYPTGKC